MKVSTISFFLIVFLCSCESSIDIDTNHKGSQLVVEGYIQEGYPAYLFLTRSESYFNSIDSGTMSDISVNDALVFIERGDGVKHQLTYIDSYLLDSIGFSDTIGLPLKGLYLDLSYKEDNFSQSGHEYKLLIEWDNKTFSASTSIPPKYPIDSLWVERKDSLDSSYKCYIWGRMNDPDTIGNSVLIYFKRDMGWKPMDALFVPCAVSVRSDDLVNGENFEAMFARSGRLSDEDGFLLPFYGDRMINGEFSRRDIVLLRFSHIDRRTYKFWRSVDRSRNQNGNPFSEPQNLFSNIDGGLGVWGGYGVSYYYVPIVPDTVVYEAYDSVGVDAFF